MKIDICIPAFNEEEIVAWAAHEVRRVLNRIPNAECRIIVADNGSTDETARRANAVEGVTVLAVPIRGKGAAVVAAARSSKADIFGFIDADLSAEPSDILKLLALLQKKKCDVAIGSRFIDTNTVKREWLRTTLSRLFNILRKIILGLSIHDTQCGLKLMNARGKDVLAQCQETGWFFDIEFLSLSERAGLKTTEVPVQWDEYRFAGRKSKLSLIRDGFGALGALARIRRRLMED